MKKSLLTASALVLMSAAAFAQSPPSSPSPQASPPSSPATSATPSPQTLNSIPTNSTTVTNYYKQNIYDSSNNKVGEVSDVLVDRDGKVTALIVGVGGVMGAGAKDVAVPFESVKLTNQENNKFRLVMNATADSLKNAPGYKYDRSSATWAPETQK